MVKNKLEYPKALTMIRSINRPNPRARKNIQDFLNKTVPAAKSPIERGIVVIPLISITANVKTERIIIRHGSGTICSACK
jgi:hypothetical protein